MRFVFLLALAGIFSISGGPEVQAQNLTPPAPPPVTGATPPPPPPPPPPAQQLKVYVAVNGQTMGPFNKEQLAQKIASGDVTRQTLVWMEGMAQWQAASTVAAVAPLLSTAPPQPEFDAAGYMVGTWETSGQGPLPDGTMAQYSETMTLRADGSLSGFGQITANSGYGPFTMNLSSTGTWKVQAKTANSFILTTNLKITGTSPSGPPSIQTANSSALLTVIDRNTVADKDGARRYRVGN